MDIIKYFYETIKNAKKDIISIENKMKLLEDKNKALEESNEFQKKEIKDCKNKINNLIESNKKMKKEIFFAFFIVFILLLTYFISLFKNEISNLKEENKKLWNALNNNINFYKNEISNLKEENKKLWEENTKIKILLEKPKINIIETPRIESHNNFYINLLKLDNLLDKISLRL